MSRECIAVEAVVYGGIERSDGQGNDPGIVKSVKNGMDLVTSDSDRTVDEMLTC